jgi:AcrR family transcriptional regulator
MVRRSPENRRLTGNVRRSQLLAVAVRVFARNGFKGTKTREIAAEAGVNEALLFRHFPTKDDLYAALLQEKADRNCTGAILASLEQHALARDDQAYFETFATQFFDCLHSQPDFIRLMLFSALERHELAQVFRERHVKPLYQAVARYISIRQREGAFRSIRAAVAVRALTGMLAQQVVVTEIYGDRQPRISSREAIAGFTAIFLAGMKADEGDTHG